MNFYLSEIMSSIQGEGVKIGYRQVFIRFAGCNLHCQYCDTVNSLATPEYCRIEETPGSNKFVYLKNPLTTEAILNVLSKFDLRLHQAISLTGGEPLLSNSVIKEIVPTIKQLAPNIKIFLETNGTLPDKLKEILDYIDIISMDFKISSTSGFKPQWVNHLDFLATAKTKEVYVKAVVSNDTSIQEIEKITTLIKEVDYKIPLILQPMTIGTTCKELAINPPQLFNLLDTALTNLPDVRVIPQTHLFLGLL